MKKLIKKIVVTTKQNSTLKVNCQRTQCRTTHKRKDC